MASIEDLPMEQLFQVLLDVPAEDISSFCRTRKEYSEVCRSEAFWREKAQRDFGRPLIGGTPYQRYMRMKRVQEIDEDSWEITLPYVYYYTDLFANNAYRIYELIDFWFHYPLKIMSDPGLMGMLAKWNEDLQRSRITIDEIKEGINGGLLNELENGPSIDDFLYGNYPEGWGSDRALPEDALYPEGMDPEEFTRFIDKITYRSNPGAYTAVWNYLLMVNERNSGLSYHFEDNRMVLDPYSRSYVKDDLYQPFPPQEQEELRRENEEMSIEEANRRIPLTIYEIIQRRS